MKFKYEGYDKNSIMRIGTVEAENLTAAYTVLQMQGVTVVNLTLEKISLKKIFHGQVDEDETWRTMAVKFFSRT